MGLSIRKRTKPLEVAIGGVTFRVNPVTAAARLRAQAEARAASGGRLDNEEVSRRLYRYLLAGWEGLQDADSGEAIPFGPCPSCGAPEGAGDAPGADVPQERRGCPDCGGVGGSREWALRAFPENVWTPLLLKAFETVRAEEEQAKN